MLDRLNKLREERTKDEQGFTLIELLVVVVIIGILIAIAIPLYLNYTKGANDKSAQSDLRGAVATLEQCNSDNAVYASGLGALANLTYPITSTPTCDQTIKVSDGTTLTYFPKAAADFSAYSIYAVNSKGKTNGTETGGYWCYASSFGGAVVKKVALTPNAYTAAC